MKSRVVANKYVCLKSTAIITGYNLEELVFKVQDFETKRHYDDTFEEGHYVAQFPFDSYIVYFKYKKVVVVSSRDMVVACKIHRVIVYFNSFR